MAILPLIIQYFSQINLNVLSSVMSCLRVVMSHKQINNMGLLQQEDRVSCFSFNTGVSQTTSNT